MQRTLGFARHLPKYGWNATVLTPSSFAYPATDIEQLHLIPEGLHVYRAAALDTARHLSIRGRYPDLLAVPDRWVSWIPGALLAGLRAIRNHRPSVIWSTYPLATSHVIGSLLSRWSRIPWISDFRDPMVEKDPRTGQYTPSDSRIRKARLRIEAMCTKRSAALVFCTESARRICVERHDDIQQSRCHVIPNGYEEELFKAAESSIGPLPLSAGETNKQFRILHSGTIYPTPDRDPQPFFQALASLKQAGLISRRDIRVTLRASGHDQQFRPLIENLCIEDLVEFAPAVPYAEALKEMIETDGLLVFQGYTSNPAIPAKLYEYLRAGTPILALVDREGSTADLLRSLGTGHIAPIDDCNAIADAILSFLTRVSRRQYCHAGARALSRYSRESLTSELAEIFESVSQPKRHLPPRSSP